MNIEGINWDEVPETLSLEQLYKLIHVSKGIAQLLLVSKIPCVINDNATHKYTVKKRDLIKYLGTHLGTHSLRAIEIVRGANPRLLISDIPDSIKQKMSFILSTHLAGYPDLLIARDISEITGYSRATVGNWLREGKMRSIIVKGKRYIPKSDLIQYMCTAEYDSICRKSQRHKELIKRIKDTL